MLYSAAVLILFSLCSGTHAQTASTVQGDWVVPSLPDNSYSVMNGEKCDNTNVDLWVMGGNIYIKIAEGIDVTSTLSYTWTVDIGTAQLAPQPVWVFRFIPAKTEWSGECRSIDIVDNIDLFDNDDLSIARYFAIFVNTRFINAIRNTNYRRTNFTFYFYFYLYVYFYISIVNSFAIFVNTCSSTSFTTTSTGNAISSSTSNPVPAASNSRKLSTGAKAGIGIGAVIGALTVFLLGWILAKRTKSSATSDPASDAFIKKEKTTSHANTTTPNAQELGVTSNTRATPSQPPTSELEGTSARIVNPAELEGYDRH